MHRHNVEIIRILSFFSVSGVYVEKVADSSGEGPYTGLLGIGDEILQVNGEPVAGLSLDQVTRLMTRESTASLRVMPARRLQRWKGRLPGTQQLSDFNSDCRRDLRFREFSLTGLLNNFFNSLNAIGPCNECNYMHSSWYHACFFFTATFGSI